MKGLNEVWELHVALHNNTLPFTKWERAQAEVIVSAFLGSFTGGTWENPVGALNNDGIKVADQLLKKAHLRKLNPPMKYAVAGFKVIADWFVSHKKKVLFLTPEGRPIELSAAPMDGKNPGAVYVKVHNAYAGKITPNGTYLPSTDKFNKEPIKADITAALEERVSAMLAEAKASAVADTKMEAGYSMLPLHSVQSFALLDNDGKYLSVSEQLKNKIADAIAKNGGEKW